MTYRLVVSPQAFEAWEAHVDYLAIDQQAPEVAERWFRKSWAALQTLKRMPDRCTPAPETDRYPYTIRALIVDRCLFLFRIDEEAKAVRVLDFRHGSQQPRPLDMQDD